MKKIVTLFTDIISDSQVQTDEEIEEQIEITEDDSPECLAFLRHVEPIVSRALKMNWTSHAFDGKV